MLEGLYRRIKSTGFSVQQVDSVGIVVSIFFSIFPILYNPNIDPIYTPIYYSMQVLG